jgi:hypothetical protein
VTSSVIGHLILKDWRLNRRLISLCIGVGLIALVIAQYGGKSFVFWAACGSLCRCAFSAVCCLPQPS